MKKCSKCFVEKEISEFNKQSKCKDGIRSYCRDCQKAYRFSRRDYFNKIGKIYYNTIKTTPEFQEKREKNKPKKKIFNKKYKSENKTTINEVTRVYNAKRTKEDPLFVPRRNVKTIIRNSLFLEGTKKNSKAQRILGCSFDFLREHLARTAVANYGFFTKIEDFQVDHIVPIDLAKSEEEIERMSHYSNLQFLTKEDNVQKSNSLTYTLPYPPVMFPVSNELEYEKYSNLLTIYS